jgi:uncharacterized membrane protein
MPITRPNNPKNFLGKQELARVTAKIAGAEQMTSAEIKVVIVRQCWTDLRKKARKIFKKHGLDKTAGRNCVLIALVTTNRELLIYGDRGIHEKVGQHFWDEARNAMIAKFKEDEFGEGLSAGIHLVGQKLAPLFPYQEGDVDEISNEVVFENF